MPESFNITQFIFDIDRQLENLLTSGPVANHTFGEAQVGEFANFLVRLPFTTSTVYNFKWDPNLSVDDNIKANIKRASDLVLSRIDAQIAEIQSNIKQKFTDVAEDMSKKIGSDLQTRADRIASSAKNKIKIKSTKSVEKYIEKFEGNKFKTMKENLAQKRYSAIINNEKGIKLVKKFSPNKTVDTRTKASLVALTNEDFNAEDPTAVEEYMISNPVAQQKIEKNNAISISQETGNDFIWGANGYINEYEDNGIKYKEGINKALRFPITNEKYPDIEDFNRKLQVPFYFIDLRSNNYCYFNAIITSLGDNFNPQWSRENYFGRSEGLDQYTNTDRDIPINFSVVPETPRDLIFMYKKLDWLAQATYPKYKNNDTSSFIEKAPIIRMRVGDIVKTNGTGLAGYITSLSYEYDLSMGWETRITGLKVPRKIDVSIAFTVIHDKIPGYSRNTKFFDITTSFSGLTEKDLYRY